jgi:hypothetical protein
MAARDVTGQVDQLGDSQANSRHPQLAGGGIRLECFSQRKGIRKNGLATTIRASRHRSPQQHATALDIDNSASDLGPTHVQSDGTWASISSIYVK